MLQGPGVASWGLVHGWSSGVAWRVHAASLLADGVHGETNHVDGGGGWGGTAVATHRPHAHAWPFVGRACDFEDVAVDLHTVFRDGLGSLVHLARTVCRIEQQFTP